MSTLVTRDQMQNLLDKLGDFDENVFLALAILWLSSLELRAEIGKPDNYTIDALIRSARACLCAYGVEEAEEK